jgi:CelD/BcsL family acetyltransferase involved in cellulose biosynthesis
VRASILELDQLSDGDVEPWRALAAEAVEPNPFFEPEYVLPAAELIGGRRVGLLVAREADHWAACLPVHRPRRWHRMPLRGVATWEHRYCFLGTPLVHTERVESASAALLSALVEQRGASFAGLDALADEGPVREAVRAAIEGRGAEEVPINRHQRATLRRPGAGEGAPAVKGKHRRELERKRRRLEEELGAELGTVDLAQDAAAVEDFLALEASGWKGRSGTALASMHGDAEFFRAICSSYRELGRLHLLSLQADGKRVAMACNLRAGDGVFCLKIAFDERWRRYSPGALLVLDHLSWFGRGSDAAWMDSCVQPDNELVNRLWPDRRGIATVAIPVSSVRGRLAASAIGAAVRLRERRTARGWEPRPGRD